MTDAPYQIHIGRKAPFVFRRPHVHLLFASKQNLPEKNLFLIRKPNRLKHRIPAQRRPAGGRQFADGLFGLSLRARKRESGTPGP